jgi:hypothetical protein
MRSLQQLPEPARINAGLDGSSSHWAGEGVLAYATLMRRCARVCSSYDHGTTTAGQLATAVASQVLRSRQSLARSRHTVCHTLRCVLRFPRELI